MILEEAGYDVWSSENVAGGLEILHDVEIDVVLMDIMLPEIDGFEGVQLICDDPKISHIPVIAVTAYAMRGDQERILKAGFVDYVPKPYDESEMLEKIRKALVREGARKSRDGGAEKNVVKDDESEVR